MLPVLDPQLEPKMTASRKDSLGETYVDRHRAALCLLAHRDEEQRAAFTGPTVCVGLLQVVHQDRGELSRRINLVKDAAQSPNAILERSNQKEGKGDAS